MSKIDELIEEMKGESLDVQEKFKEKLLECPEAYFTDFFKYVQYKIKNIMHLDDTLLLLIYQAWEREIKRKLNE